MLFADETTLFVKETYAEVHGLPGLKDKFSRNNLDMSSRPIGIGQTFHGYGLIFHSSGFFSDTVEIRVADEIDASVGYSNRTNYCFRKRFGTKLILIQNLTTSRTWFENEELSIFRPNI